MVGKLALHLPGIKCKVNYFDDVGPAWPPDVWFTLDMYGTILLNVSLDYKLLIIGTFQI